MGFDQKGSTNFTVSRNSQGKWEVCEQGFPKPLALFDSEGDAQKYAQGLSNVKEGSQPQPDGKSAGR